MRVLEWRRRHGRLRTERGCDDNDARDYQGRDRDRRDRLEYSRPDLCAEAAQRIFVFLARHIPARHVRSAAHSSNPGRIHLHARRQVRSRPRGPRVYRYHRRSDPAADANPPRHLQQDRPGREVLVLGDADAKALRPVLGDPRHERAVRRRTSWRSRPSTKWCSCRRPGADSLPSDRRAKAGVDRRPFHLFASRSLPRKHSRARWPCAARTTARRRCC